MKLSVIFYNICDLTYFASRLKVLGISYRIKLNLQREKEDKNYDFLLVLNNGDVKVELISKRLCFIYSSKELLLEKDIWMNIYEKLGEEGKLLITSSDNERGIRVLGGYIQYFNSKDRDHAYFDLLGNLEEIFNDELFHFSLKSLNNDDSFKTLSSTKRKVLLFDGEGERSAIKVARELVKEKKIEKNLYVSGFDFIEAVYGALREITEEEDNRFIIISSRKDEENLKSLREIIKDSGTESYNLNIYSLIINPEEEEKRAYNYLIHNKRKVICLTTALNKEDIVNLHELALSIHSDIDTLKERIEKSLIYIARRLMEQDERINCIMSLRLSTAISLLKDAGISSLDFQREICQDWYSVNIDLNNRLANLLLRIGELEQCYPLKEVLTKYSSINTLKIRDN